MDSVERRAFLKEYTHALNEGETALFVGAGVSQAAAYVNWKQLLKEIAEELDLDVDREPGFGWPRAIPSKPFTD
jgi:hypothetical protein